MSSFTNALTLTNTLFDNVGPSRSRIAIDELTNCIAPVWVSRPIRSPAT